ncbi:MAG: IS4 family transposase [Cyanobacteria bacterium J06614_10]
MNQGKTIFRQLSGLVSRYEFSKCVNRYHGNRRIRQLSCYQQFLCMIFGQLTRRESLRDIIVCLNAQGRGLYHLGLGKGVARSTLSDANNRRDWRIFADFAQYLMKEATTLYTDCSEQAQWQESIFALDSSLIRLCIDLFGWARYRKTTAAVKMHVMLDIQTAIPNFFHLSDGKDHDLSIFDLLDFEPGAFYVMDRGYVDFSALYRIEQAKAFFVIRAKKNLRFVRMASISRPQTVRKTIMADQMGHFANHYSAKDYPDKLRRIRLKDLETGKSIVLLTNHLGLDADQIGQMYRSRWRIELFFKWIKQHLRIKVFWGYSENAVKIQLYTALAAYLLVAIARKKLNLSTEMNQMLQILSVNIFAKMPLNQLFTEQPSQISKNDDYNQLSIW